MKLSRDILESVLSNTVLDHKGKNLYGTCPYCDHNEFGISLEEGHLFSCFRKSRCGETGNIFKLLKYLNRLDLIHGYKKEIDYSETLTNLIDKQYEQLDLSLPDINLPIGFKRIQNHPYLDSRRFSSYNKMKIGTTIIDPDFKNYIIFIIEDNKEVKGFVGRHQWSKEKIDYFNKQTGGKKIRRWNNSKTDFSKLLGGYDEITRNIETVILVESLFVKDRIDRLLGLDDTQILKCCCTFGAKISKEQVLKLQLKGVRNIVILFDNDAVNKIQKHSTELMTEFKSVEIAFLEQGDLDNLDFNTLYNLISDAKSPTEFYFSKLPILTLK